MRRTLALTMGVAMLLAACTPTPDTTGFPSPSATTAPAITADAATPSPSPSATEESTLSYIAQAKSKELTVLTSPDGGEEMTIKAADVLTVPDATPFVFLVKEIRDSWVELYLPVRPNGTTGWVKADQVTLVGTHMRVEVSLSDFELTVFDGDLEVLSTPIGLGQDDLPTPGGVYYIRELLAPPDPTGPYGPYAYGLSGYSPVLDEFNGGDAVIGLHGTNEPEAIGTKVSHGCIRLPNGAITALVEQVGLPLGAPVYIDEA